MVILVFALGSGMAQGVLYPKQVTILYSDQPNSDFPYGDLSLYYATALKNLLGGYGGLEVKLQTVGKYRAGDAAKQLRVFYLGTFFGQKVPPALISDTAGGAPVTWINYGLNDFGPKLEALSLRYVSTQAAENPSQSATAFNQIRYHKQIFSKYLGPSEITEVEITQTKEVAVQAWAINGLGREIPYALQKGNFWYIADNPFLSIHERDRYLVFADLLANMLGQSQSCSPRALLRLEGLSPGDNPALIKSLLDSLERLKIPFAASTIPLYQSQNTRLTWEERPLMLEQMRRAAAIGGRVFQNGTARSDPLNPSSSDWEFWDKAKNAPLPDMTPLRATDRALQGKEILEKLGLRPVGWITPNYRTDPSYYPGFNVLYERFFERRQVQVGKIIAWQFFPYPVMDINDSLILPENLGPLSQDRLFGGLLETAKLNLALRCPWAGFYIQPALFEGKTTPQDLEAFVLEMQKMGYVFVDPLSVEVQ